MYRIFEWKLNVKIPIVFLIFGLVGIYFDYFHFLFYDVYGASGLGVGFEINFDVLLETIQDGFTSLFNTVENIDKDKIKNTMNLEEYGF